VGHKEEIIDFIRQNPGSTQEEIRIGTNINPTQQIYNILKKLMANNVVSRETVNGLFVYNIRTSLKIDSGAVLNINTNIVKDLKPGMSSEQQQVEEWLVSQLSDEIGVPLKKQRMYPVGRSWLEVDGYHENPLVLCEAWAHIGRPKSAQKNKVMADALKLLYIKKYQAKEGRYILLFGNEQAASHFLCNSWNAKCLEHNGIEVKVIKFPKEIENRVYQAQLRQKR